MNRKSLLVSVVAASFTLAQATPAFAHGRGGWHHGAGPIIGLAAVGTALVVGTAELLSAPFVALNEAANQPPPPVYNQAPPQYYAQQAPVYAPPVMYYQQPQYYAAPPVYYGRGYYVR